MTRMEQETAAVILAGGQARRMGGGDKPLRSLGGRPLLAHVLAALAPQVSAVALSANGDAARFAAWSLPVLADAPGTAGPLAGVLAGMDWAAARGAGWLLSCPGDCPVLPADLLARLRAAGGRAAVAEAGGRVQPVVGLWHVGLRGALAAALAGGERRAGAWAAACGARLVAWPAGAFVSVNTPEELAMAERLLGASSSQASWIG